MCPIAYADDKYIDTIKTLLKGKKMKGMMERMESYLDMKSLMLNTRR